MKVKMSRENKITLLKWLQQGYIDREELHNLQVENQATDEEIENFINKYIKILKEIACEKCREFGFCFLEKGG